MNRAAVFVVALCGYVAIVSLGATFSGVTLSGTRTAIAPPGAAAYNVEARCTALGSGCLTSEPFNTPNQYAVTQGGSYPADYIPCATYQANGFTNYPDVDFGDSEGAGAKEASRAWSNCLESVPIATTGGPADMTLPTGTSNVGYVMKLLPPAGTMYSTNFPAGKTRLCERSYKRYSANYHGSFTAGGAIDCAADKVQEIWTFGSTAIQTQEWGSSGNFQLNILDYPGPLGTHIGWSNYEYNINLVPNLSFRDCQSNWCRMEMCISTTDADVRTLTNITVETTIQQVGVGSPIVATASRFAGTWVRGEGLGEFWPLLNYRVDQAGTCGSDPTIYGYSYASHAMVAGWTTNAGQTIGAAVEVEGP